MELSINNDTQDNNKASTLNEIIRMRSEDDGLVGKSEKVKFGSEIRLLSVKFFQLMFHVKGG